MAIGYACYDMFDDGGDQYDLYWDESFDNLNYHGDDDADKK